MPALANAAFEYHSQVCMWMFIGAAYQWPLTLMTPTMGSGSSAVPVSRRAISSTSLSMSSSMMSRNCLEVLNWAAVGGLPPMMRLTVTARDWSPPAMALSIQVPPASR
jgi:hypothetical protein